MLSVGFNNSQETEGGDRSFDLPLGQNELIQQIAAQDASLGKKTVVVLSAGGSVDVTPWKDRVGAILQSWYPGEDGGTAVADLLLGDADPSGHLPISWEAKLTDNPSFGSYYPKPGSADIYYKEGIYVGYRGYDHLNRKPLFPFGFGLSYTNFAYSGLQVKPGVQGHASATFTVKNTGSKAGATVAQLYVSPKASAREPAKVDRPEKELKGFERVQLEPGQSRTVTLNLGPRDFAYWDTETGEWNAAAGQYTLRVGDSSESLPLSGSLAISKDLHIPVSN